MPPAADGTSLAIAIRSRSDPSLRGKTRRKARVDVELIREARQRWNRCNEAEDKQRQAILNAKRFAAGDQWPSALKIQREGGNAIAGQSPQPPRPCLVVDRLSQPMRQTTNQIKSADFTFDVLPNSIGANQETADVFKGLLRRIQDLSRDDSPVNWAAGQAIEGGIGWFRILTAYVHEDWQGEPTEEIFDQELRLGRIANNLTVYADPYAIKPTRSDMQFAFVTEDLDRDEFTRRFKGADVAGLEDFAATGDCPKEWVTANTIRIAEYWRISYEQRQFVWTEDGQIHEGEAPNGATVRMARTMAVPKVKGSKINAFQELPREDGEPDTWEWPGSRIPLVPILGEELNIDGITKLRGMIEPGMDAQKMVNYTYSGAVELFALANKSPVVAASDAVANYKSIWDQMNTVNYAWLPWDPWDDQGRPLPPPTVAQFERPNALQAAVSLMQVSEESIKATTNFFDASLGNLNPQQRSGSAIQSLQAQADIANSNYGESVQRALVYAGRLIVEILPKITRPGQILHVLGADDRPNQVMIGQAFTRGPNGQPVAVPGMTKDQALASQFHEFYDLNEGTYRVTVVMAKAQATRASEGSAALAQLIPHLPPEMQAVATPDYVAQLNFSGATALSEKLKKVLPPALQDDQQQGPLPPAIAAQIQHLQTQLQQAQQIIATKQAEKQIDLQIAQMKAQTDTARELQLQEMKNAATIAVARINAGKAAFDTVVEAQEERLSTGIQIAHEVREAAKDRAHEVGIAHLDHVQTSLQDAHAHQNALEQTAQSGAIASQQQADAAAQHATQPTQPGGAP